jgi:hypothetical protein
MIILKNKEERSCCSRNQDLWGIVIRLFGSTGSHIKTWSRIDAVKIFLGARTGYRTDVILEIREVLTDFSINGARPIDDPYNKIQN